MYEKYDALMTSRSHDFWAIPINHRPTGDLENYEPHPGVNMKFICAVVARRNPGHRVFLFGRELGVSDRSTSAVE